MVDIALLEHQEDFVFSEAPHPLLCGGLGSGKSRAAIIRMILLMLESPGTNTMIAFPTYDLLRLRAMPGAEEDLLSIGIPFKINKSEWTISIKGYGNIYFRSYDNPSRMVAFEVGHAVADELDTLPRHKAAEVWRKITERVRQPTLRPNSVAVVTTPDQGVNGFTYDKWVKSGLPGYELVKAKTKDNPFLPEGYIDQILANYDPILADAYLRGEFVSFTANKVYHFFDKRKHHSDLVIKPGERLHIGLDFNIGGTCGTVFVLENGNPIAVDEITSHDTQDFITRLEPYKGHEVRIYPDASGRARGTNASRSDVQMIEAAGYRVSAPNANPAVRDRINSVNAMLSKGKLLVNTAKCPELTEAMLTQGYTERGEPEKWDKHPAFDDRVDSAGYYISQAFPIDKPVAYTGIGGPTQRFR